MENLHLGTIPSSLLARILLQLHTLPPRDYAESVQVLSSGLDKYGHTSDLNAFLNHCSSMVLKSDNTWLWKHYDINNDLDWDQANLKKPQDLVGLRFLIASETARKKVQLARYGRKNTLNPKCFHLYGDRILPVDQILKDTLEILKKEEMEDEIVKKLIGLRLEQYERDSSKTQQESTELDTADYHLMGALLVRYDSSASEGNAPNAWCLYLRDYMNSEDGTKWRVILKDGESAISSEQALADIRGIPDENNTSIEPSAFSKEYRPVYLFYVNQEILIQPDEEETEGEQHITLDDYTFDEDEYEYEVQTQPPEENENCKHCGVSDIIDDVNDMFFCEMCDKGVHQLCEDPPIQAFEKKVDPWYCRACCVQQNIPFPTPPQLSVDEMSQMYNMQKSDLPVKRKRTEEEEESSKK